ncbi:MAG TPA: diacylglycerol kinase, partial [Steroidobacteraceae bacterium]|nr:diacylglycerol kinase [Steroidobacteraceae bacterium]
ARQMIGHKNQPIYKRVGFALAGIGYAVRSEQSAKIQVGAFVVVVVALLILRPGPFWWALIMLASAGVFAAEMFNTAIEHLADHLHPEIHPHIRAVKDCAAAGVLIASLGATAVAVALVVHLIKN